MLAIGLVWLLAGTILGLFVVGQLHSRRLLKAAPRAIVSLPILASLCFILCFQISALCYWRSKLSEAIQSGTRLQAMEQGVEIGKRLYQSRHSNELKQLLAEQEKFIEIKAKELENKIPSVGKPSPSFVAENVRTASEDGEVAGTRM